MTSPFVVVPIVEGHGEVEAVPALLRRVAAALDPARPIEVRRPLRVHRDRVVKDGELERYVELAVRSADGDGAVLVLLDADDDCPATLGPWLLRRAKAVRPHAAMAVVLANREFEAWLLAAAQSLRGHRGLAGDLNPPGDPESVRDAKGWLQDSRHDGFAYSPTADQPALVTVMDLDLAREASTSFAKLWRDVEHLMTAT